MSHLIFSNEQFLAKLTELHQMNLEVSINLFKRLGVNPQPTERVTMLVISKDSGAGHNALFTLAIECERAYKKTVDTLRMKSIVLRSLEEASRSPHLERASFILILDENLLGIENYPELEHILPFVEK